MPVFFSVDHQTFYGSRDEFVNPCLYDHIEESLTIVYSTRYHDCECASGYSRIMPLLLVLYMGLNKGMFTVIHGLKNRKRLFQQNRDMNS